MAVEPNVIHLDQFSYLEEDYSAFLGLNSSKLAKWERGELTVGYDHSDAPSELDFVDIETMIVESINTLEGIADVDIEYIGAFSGDHQDYSDGIVHIGWVGESSTLAAQASTRFSSSHTELIRLGYYPYKDGSISLNNSSATSVSSSLFTHELIHILGLGHSENPASIMSSSRFRHDFPQQDDVNALQALYGPPDEYFLPAHNKDFELNSARSAFEVNSQLTGFHSLILGADPETALQQIVQVDATLERDSNIYYQVAFAEAEIGESVRLYVTDPSGYIDQGNRLELMFEQGRFWLFVAEVGEMRKFPGTWEISLELNGGLLMQDAIHVVDVGFDYNRTPTAKLSSTFNNDELFSLELDVTDTEGDPVRIDWYIPFEFPRNDGFADETVTLGRIGVKQVYAWIQDVVDRNANLEASDTLLGTGFGALLSKYLAIPAEQGVPTYYLREELLFIPNIEVGGESVSVFLGLTSLEGTVLKLLAVEPPRPASEDVLSRLDLNSKLLILGKLLVSDGSSITEYTNLEFSLDLDANPLKIRLVN